MVASGYTMGSSWWSLSLSGKGTLVIYKYRYMLVNLYMPCCYLCLDMLSFEIVVLCNDEHLSKQHRGHQINPHWYFTVTICHYTSASLTSKCLLGHQNPNNVHSQNSCPLIPWRIGRNCVNVTSINPPINSMVPVWYNIAIQRKKTAPSHFSWWHSWVRADPNFNKVNYQLPFLPESWKWNTSLNDRKLVLEGCSFHFHDCHQLNWVLEHHQARAIVAIPWMCKPPHQHASTGWASDHSWLCGIFAPVKFIRKPFKGELQQMKETW